MISSEEYPAGSPAAGEPAFLAVGRIRRPHGVRGEVLMEIYTDFPERLQPQIVVYTGQRHKELTIVSIRGHNDGLLLGFKGITSPEEAGFLRNQIVYIDAKDRPDLPKGEYYHDHLIGMQVVNEQGDILGTLTEILQTGANDVYVVKGSKGRELLLPAIPEVILEVDLSNKTMRIHLLPGLDNE